MQIVDCVQKSGEWFKLRELRMTASHAQAISANGAGLNTYIKKLTQEYYSAAEPKRFSNRHTERGNEYEDSAAFLYSMDVSLPTKKIGFVIHSDYAGCSPDLFVGDLGMAEIKCPDDPAYFEMLHCYPDFKIETKYIWQMQMQMMICRKEWCDFVAYNPNYKKSMIIKRIVPDLKAGGKIRMGLISGEDKIRRIQNRMETISK